MLHLAHLRELISLELRPPLSKTYLAHPGFWMQEWSCYIHRVGLGKNFEAFNFLVNAFSDGIESCSAIVIYWKKYAEPDTGAPEERKGSLPKG